MEVGHKLSDQFALNASYILLDATNSDIGARLADRPRSQINAGLQYTDKKHAVTGRLWGTLISDVIATTAGSAQKSYSTWNLLLSKDINKTTTIYLGADNLFNFYDEELKIFGTTFKTGLRIKF